MTDLTKPDPVMGVFTSLKSTDDDVAKWRSVFVERGADYIIFDGWVGRAVREQVARAVDDGLLAEDERTSQLNSDDQYTAICFRPTEKLRELLVKVTS